MQSPGRDASDRTLVARRLSAAWRPAALARILTSAGRGAGWLRSVVIPLALSLLCLRSVFRDGYLLQVDIGFGPRAWPIGWEISAPVAALEWAAVHTVGGQAAGKIYAVGALFLAGFGPMVLFRHAVWYAQCVAGFLGALNPFVYDRMIEGQWGVVVAAAGLFLWLAAWETLQAKPSLRRAAVVALCTDAIAAFDPHVLGPVAVLVLVGAIATRIWRHRERLRWSGVSLALLALLLLPGVIRFFVGSSSGGYGAVRQFTRADFDFFRSTTSPDYGLLVNLLGLFGYWGERIGRFPLAHGGQGWWPLATAVVVGTALPGAWLRRDRAWLLVCGLIGLALSASTAVPGGVGAAAWIAARIPLVAVYREPEKWSALWLLAVTVLAAGTVEALPRSRLLSRERARIAGPTLAYLLVLAALVPGGVSQARSLPTIVKPVLYPDYWYKTAAFLSRNVPDGEPIAVLPWHLYQPLRVSEGRLVANPAEVFFPGRLIVPHNVEIPGRATEITSRYDRIGLAGRADGKCNLPRTLHRERIRWALVLDGAESAETVRRLRNCGYSLVQGRPGFTGLLHG
jgi:hypothetical protein